MVIWSQRHMGSKASDDRGRDWNYPAVSWGMLTFDGDITKWERGSIALLTPSFYSTSLQNCETITFCVFFLLFFPPGPVACGILVPQPGIEPRPQQWEWQVLAIGPPGNSQISVVLSHPSLWYFIAAALESLTQWPLPRFDYFIKGCEMVIFE